MEIMHLVITTRRTTLFDYLHALWAWVMRTPVYMPPHRRTQPRDGRGRFLSRAWLKRAESLSESDVAWFRPTAR